MSKLAQRDQTQPFKQKLKHAAKIIVSGILSPWAFSFKKDPATGKRKFDFHFPPLRVLAFFVTYWVVQPLTIFFFPRAEEVLQKGGLDPKIIADITPTKDIRVIPDTFAGKLYRLTREVPNPRAIYEVAKRIQDKETVGFCGDDGGIVPGLFSKGVTPIYIKNIGDVSRLLCSGQENRQHILMHEIRHTNPDNWDLPPSFREADADYAAIFSLSENGKDKEKVDRLIYAEALSETDELHESTLYLWHKFNKQAMPNEEDLLDANKEALPLLEKMYEARYCPDSTTAKILQKQFEKTLSQASALAHLRVILTQEALNKNRENYFKENGLAYLIPAIPAAKPYPGIIRD